MLQDWGQTEKAEEGLNEAITIFKGMGMEWDLVQAEQCVLAEETPLRYKMTYRGDHLKAPIRDLSYDVSGYLFHAFAYHATPRLVGQCGEPVLRWLGTLAQVLG